MSQQFRVMFQPNGRARWLSYGKFADEGDAYIAWGKLKDLGYRAWVVFAS